MYKTLIRTSNNNYVMPFSQNGKLEFRDNEVPFLFPDSLKEADLQSSLEKGFGYTPDLTGLEYITVDVDRIEEQPIAYLYMASYDKTKPGPDGTDLRATSMEFSGIKDRTDGYIFTNLLLAFLRTFPEMVPVMKLALSENDSFYKNN